MSTMTKAEYARHRGITSAAVTDMVKRGSICVLPDGSVDQEISDILLEAYSPGTKNKPRDEQLDHISDEARQQIMDGITSTGSYAAHRAQLTRAKAEIEQLKLEQLKAESIRSADVYSEAYDCGKQLCDSIFGIADRLAAVLAAESSEAEIRKILDREFRKILGNVCDDILKKYSLPEGAN